MTNLFAEPQQWKAISLWQPWASLVARGLKPDETRHWSTEYRGPLAIQAARKLDTAGAPEALCHSAFGQFWYDQLPLGCIVAVAWLKGVVRAEGIVNDITRANRAAGNFTHGRYAWRLEDVRPVLKPIPIVGRQGLFNWTPPADLAANLGAIRDHRAVCHKLGWS